MATALAHRVKPYSPRGKVSQGDINLHLVPLMKKHFDPYKPWLCVLDPEGTELDWRTIEAISKSKARGRKPELLILLPDTGFVRTLWLERDLEEWAELAMLRIFGNEEWREIFEARKRGLSPDEARTRYVRLYAEGIRNLDYEFVLDRQIRKPDGSPLYFLLFATDHHVGRELMDHCFDRIWSPEGGQLSLLTKQPRGRRLPK